MSQCIWKYSKNKKNAGELVIEHAPWFGHLFGFSHVCESHSTFNSTSLLLCIKNKLKERYEQFWEKHMKSEEKMI